MADGGGGAAVAADTTGAPTGGEQVCEPAGGAAAAEAAARLWAWRGQWEQGWTHLAPFRGGPRGGGGEGAGCMLFRYCRATGQSELVDCELLRGEWRFTVTQHWQEEDHKWDAVFPLRLPAADGAAERELVLLYAGAGGGRDGLCAMLEISGGEAWYAREDAVTTAWTHFVPYTFAASPFLLCYDSASGAVGVLEVMRAEAGSADDLALRPRGGATFGEGWTDVVVKVSSAQVSTKKRSRQRFFCYNARTGETAFETIQLTDDGGVAEASAEQKPPARTAKRKECMMIPLAIGERSCAHFYRPQQSDVEWRYRPRSASPRGGDPADGTAGLELLHKRIQAIPHAWTHVCALSPYLPDRGHVLCYSGATGAVWCAEVRVDGGEGDLRLVACERSPRRAPVLPPPHYPGTTPEPAEAADDDAGLVERHQRHPGGPGGGVDTDEGSGQELPLIPPISSPGAEGAHGSHPRQARTEGIPSPPATERPRDAYAEELEEILRGMSRGAFHGATAYCQRALESVGQGAVSPPRDDAAALRGDVTWGASADRSRDPVRPMWVHVCRSDGALPPPSRHAARAERCLQRRMESSKHARRTAEEIDAAAARLLPRVDRVEWQQHQIEQLRKQEDRGKPPLLLPPKLTKERQDASIHRMHDDELRVRTARSQGRQQKYLFTPPASPPLPHPPGLIVGLGKPQTAPRPRRPPGFPGPPSPPPRRAPASAGAKRPPGMR